MKAYLILEDGSIFVGEGTGISGDVISKIQFNTSMAGYLEIITDPSVLGQAVVMTYPITGSYGVNLEDAESDAPKISAFITREISRCHSNFRSELSLTAYFETHKIPVIADIDTRALTRILRDKGLMKGMITANPSNIAGHGLTSAISRIKSAGCDCAPVNSNEQPSLLSEGKYKTAVLDLGLKKSMAKKLSSRGAAVKSYPAGISAEAILRDKPDGVFISSGPGNPDNMENIIQEIKKLIDSGIPVFGVGLGHVLMAKAMGAYAKLLKVGHHGANIPVRENETGKIYITTQSHEYAVSDEALPEACTVTHNALNDESISGLSYKDKKAFSLQFYPEGTGIPGTEFYYDNFISLMEGK